MRARKHRHLLLAGALVAAGGALLVGWFLRDGADALPSPRDAQRDAAALATPEPAASEVAPAAAAMRDLERPIAAPDADAGVPASDAGLDSRHPEWRPIVLDVLDRTTRAPLPGVELVVAPWGGSHSGGTLDDSVELPIVARGDSPLQVPAGAAGMASSTFLVRAPGHASATIALDFAAGGARELLLEPACQLRILVDAPPGNAALLLELRRIDEARAWLERKSALGVEYAAAVGRKPSAWTRSRLLAAGMLRQGELLGDPTPLAVAAKLTRAKWTRKAARGGWVTFDRLAPGDWIATLIEEQKQAPSLGAALARLRPGESAERTITLREPVPPRAVKVAGTITLGQGWATEQATSSPGLLELEMSLRLPGMPDERCQRRIEKFTSDDAGRFRWDAGELLPGVYFARLPRFGYAAEFEVKPDEPADFDLVVGPPCDVTITLVDAITQERAEVSSVSYWSGDGDATHSATNARRAADAPAFRFRAAPGPLHVRLDWDGDRYWVTERVFELAAGHSDFRFELEPKACVRLLLMDGAAAVPWDDDYHVDARRIGGPGGLGGWMDSGGREVQHVLSPSGRYTIRVADVPGFEPSEPVEVEAPPGQVVDVTIALKRAK